MKSTESGMTINRGNGDMEASTELLLTANDDTPTNNHSGTNGSIITMTLKNNHLIVETEERNVSLKTINIQNMHILFASPGIFRIPALFRMQLIFFCSHYFRENTWK